MFHISSMIMVLMFHISSMTIHSQRNPPITNSKYYGSNGIPKITNDYLIYSQRCAIHTFLVGYCSVEWCSVADKHLKLLDRVVSGKGKGKVLYGQEPSSGESTTTECGVNYQLLAVITEVAQ